MEHKVTEFISYLARSHQELARIIEAKKDVVVNLGRLICAIPDDHDASNQYEAVIQNSQNVTKSLSSYLNSLADLEEALADNLSHVFKELQGNDETGGE